MHNAASMLLSPPPPPSCGPSGKSIRCRPHHANATSPAPPCLAPCQSCTLCSSHTPCSPRPAKSCHTTWCTVLYAAACHAPRAPCVFPCAAACGGVQDCSTSPCAIVRAVVVSSPCAPSAGMQCPAPWCPAVPPPAPHTTAHCPTSQCTAQPHRVHVLCPASQHRAPPQFVHRRARLTHASHAPLVRAGVRLIHFAWLQGCTCPVQHCVRGAPGWCCRGIVRMHMQKTS